VSLKPAQPAPVPRAQRQPLAAVQQHIPSHDTLDDEDADIIVIDTPEKPGESLEEQFTEVDEEYHESRSTMDIDSDDDETTEPDDDTDVEVSSKHACIPHTTKRDREELRIVRNNFAEEYDPWDTSMVPEYAEDIFRYMRELEVPPSKRNLCLFLFAELSLYL
jgi:G2/mitotic-specific cyclin 1/2